AVGDEHGALAGGDLLEPALDGAARAGDLVLVGDGHLGGVLREVLGDALALVAEHDDQLGGAGALGGGHGVHEEGSAPDLVEHLRSAGLHARPGTSGQDDHGGGGGGLGG